MYQIDTKWPRATCVHLPDTHRFQIPIGRLHMYADMDGYTCTGTRCTLTNRTICVQVPDTGRDTRAQVPDTHR